jgi:hypothetical protein
MFLKEEAKTMGVIELHKIDGKTGQESKIFAPNELWYKLNKLGIDIKIPFITGKYSFGFKFHNLITNVGFAGLAARIMWDAAEGATVKQFKYLALGISATAAAVTDTILGSEIVDSGLARAVATLTRATTTQTNDTATLTYTWTSATNTKAVTECGVFSDSSGGILLGHQVFPSISLVGTNNDQLVLTYSIKES